MTNQCLCLNSHRGSIENELKITILGICDMNNASMFNKYIVNDTHLLLGNRYEILYLFVNHEGTSMKA